MIARSFPLLLSLLALLAGRAGAQCVGTTERERDDWLTCRSLIRSGGDRTPAESLPPGRQLRVLPVRFESHWNSELPYSMNDGALWSGRGWNTSVRAGAAARYRWFRVSIEPELLFAQNRPFPILPAGTATGRDPFANPFQPAIDMPLRFGASRLASIWAGQSYLEVELPYVGVGVTAENQWWGPGIRNALVMSDNAAGIPQVYVRTGKPISTPIGEVEARVLIGALTESRFYDANSENDVRSLSAAVLTLRARFDSGLVIGASRVSYATMDGVGDLPAHAIDFLYSLPRGGRDELQSLFARWVFPAIGLEFHSEWARPHVPSLRELLVAPQRTQGYTIGAQWKDVGLRGVRPLARLEFTALEQTAETRRISVSSFYTSDRVPQGYTQRGQVLGAAIGPGSSSQFLALGAESRRGTLELTGSRIRYDDDAYFTQPSGFAHFSHDVALTGGLRAFTRRGRWTAEAELLTTHRMNYLYQTAKVFDWDSTFDMHNAGANFWLTFRP